MQTPLFIIQQSLFRDVYLLTGNFYSKEYVVSIIYSRKNKFVRDSRVIRNNLQIVISQNVR